MDTIRFDSVAKVFPDGTVALRNLAFEIKPGDTMVLIGPSGCGKTTTLRLIAGLDHPTSGAIWLGQQDLAQIAPDDRKVAMMFQSDALYPHMSVRGNLSFGLKARQGSWAQVFGRTFFRTPSQTRSRSQPKDANKPSVQVTINRVAQRLGIERLLDRKPHQLSGGERQRVALGRALVREPAVFLLDEPLSRLDARLAGELRAELRREFRELGIPVLYVTHNQREAFALADRIAVMNDGEILQIGEPSEIYRRPANRFVANFAGELPINFLPRINQEHFLAVPDSAEMIGIRSEHLNLAEQFDDSSDSINLRATVRDIEWLGDRALVRIDAYEIDALSLTACCEASVGFQVGQQVEARFDRADAMFFDSAGKRVEASN